MTRNTTHTRAKKTTRQAMLMNELELRAEYWRTLEIDPHDIARAVYVALKEVAGCLRVADCLSARKKNTNGGKRKP